MCSGPSERTGSSWCSGMERACACSPRGLMMESSAGRGSRAVSCACQRHNCRRCWKDATSGLRMRRRRRRQRSPDSCWQHCGEVNQERRTRRKMAANMLRLGVSDALPDDLETLTAMLLAERCESDRLRQIIKEMQRHRFGRRAETLPKIRCCWLGRRRTSRRVRRDGTGH